MYRLAQNEFELCADVLCDYTVADLEGAWGLAPLPLLPFIYHEMLVKLKIRDLK
jgi:hypothetical protein